MVLPLTIVALVCAQGVERGEGAEAGGIQVSPEETPAQSEVVAPPAVRVPPAVPEHEEATKEIETLR